MILNAVKDYLKGRALRGRKARIENFDPQNHTFEVKKRMHCAKLAFKLVRFDNEIYVSFSGDKITSDDDCLQRITKLLWNTEIPLNFSENLIKELKEQVKREREEDTIIYTEQAAEEAGENQETETAQEDAEKKTDEVTVDKVYFRDMYKNILGNPNNVLVTLRVWKQIDE